MVLRTRRSTRRRHSQTRPRNLANTKIWRANVEIFAKSVIFFGLERDRIGLAENPDARTSVCSGRRFAHSSSKALKTRARPSVYLRKTIVGNFSLSYLYPLPVCFHLTRFSHYSRYHSQTTLVVAPTRLLTMKSVVSFEISVLESISKHIQRLPFGGEG